ncbi:YhcN/YlaJ family sporulation lipoprotein [Paenibacillus sp. PAMC21692]|uniref:YhcN/YlaJ family sporulation lipoprotein n=1 Tax=Paenibacillus sp. PAMC21692 TaxID=2762320 RepID=UPI00164D0CF8|nr:YhcN/YlaJ family sporulation lipoprotein [Paenibacillus sp. PAMC21692]QNK54481.1 YhcN/YlaJ family sporulation lipoprotein [Paenibacillus sp. PAMC21692]
MYKWIIIMIAAAVVVSGCGTSVRNEPSPSPYHNGSVRTQQNEPGKKLIEDPAAVEVRLEELAAGVEGVESAHCVIVGNTAIVGINVDGNLERSRVGVIKYSVAEALRNDPYGVDAFVTADLDISNRLAEIGQDIRLGRPIAGFAEELADIMGRIIPQVPRDIMPADNDPKARQQSGRPNTMNGDK